MSSTREAHFCMKRASARKIRIGHTSAKNTACRHARHGFIGHENEVADGRSEPLRKDPAGYNARETWVMSGASPG
jgi:hypothetical protein